MKRPLLWLLHCFVGCPMDPWLIHALASPHEGVSWTCRCGRRVTKSAKVFHERSAS